MNKLSFTKVKNNAKLRVLGDGAYTFSLPAGKSCPGADKCKASVRIVGGKRKVIDGANQEFRCFSATTEVRHTNVYKSRKRNLDILKRLSIGEIVNQFTRDLPKDITILRWHVSGDFFSQTYFDAAIGIAKKFPEVKFYAYTKSITFWIARLGGIPENFILNASYGGKYDNLIEEYGLKHSKVFFSIEDAELEGYELDHDDSLAMNSDQSKVGLLLHGTQKIATAASKAISKLRKEGIGGYKYA